MMFEELSHGPETATSPPLPPPKGRLSDIVTRAIVRPVSGHRDRLMREAVAEVLSDGVDDPLGDHDLQLALDICFELHYLSFREVDPSWEWDPGLIELRTWMESRFMDGLAEEIEAAGDDPATDVEAVTEVLLNLEPGPALGALADYVEHHSDLREMAELVIHRSAERLRRTDSYLWSIPRLNGRIREALARILEEDFPRNPLFERVMRAFGLDDRTGAYRDLFPAGTLATSNMPSMFGLRRRGRGAIVGHVAAQKLIGSMDDRACARATRRLGVDPEESRYFEESAVASEAMVEVAVSDLAGKLSFDEPRLGADILFGARSYVAVQERFSEWILARWLRSESSLLPEQAGFTRPSEG
jgi:hypothetical protein